jgi:hypothetical protein
MSEAGKVIGVRDCGTLVILFLDAGDGRVLPVPIDNKTFRRLLEGEGCSSVELVGRGLSDEQVAALQQ